MEVVQPDEEHVIVLGPVVLRLPATVRQSSTQVRLQQLGLQSQATSGGPIQNIALGEVDPTGFGAPVIQPPGQVIHAFQVDLFDVPGDAIQDVRSFLGIEIEIRLTDPIIEDLGGFGATISAHMLGRLQLVQLTPTGIWSRIHTQLNLTDRTVEASTSRLSTFALILADAPSLVPAGPGAPGTGIAGLPPLPCPEAWRVAQAC